jgi:hypothetical protein
MSRKISTASTKTTTAKETVYTVPTKNAGLWQLLYVISTTGTNTPSVYWYDSSTTNEYLVLSGKNLGTGDYVLLNQAEVVLQENDEIRIAQSGTSSVTYIFTVELVPNQAVQYHGG